MIVRHAGIAMTFGNAVSALAVSLLLLGLTSDSRSPSARPTDLVANQDERHAPAGVREPPAGEAVTPRRAEIVPPPTEPAKPSMSAPTAKPPSTRSVAPPGRTSAGGLATKASPSPPTTTPPATTPPAAGTPPRESAPRSDQPPATGAEPRPGSAPPSVVAAPQPAIPAAGAPLDLSSLEQRLRDTKAIGVFTKLSLKNQVDDLLQEFREFHKSQDQTMLTKLRQSFDLLLLKVLSLLQDGDPALARDISSSREDLWGILIDPEKFKNVD